jgi:hypothetical protein
MAETQTLETWTRPHFSAGGGDAFLFYAVVGKFTQPLSVSRSKHRTNGVPPTIKVGSHRDWLADEVLKTFTEDYFGEVLRENRLDEIVLAAPECITVTGEIPDPQDLNYFRDTVGFITALVEHGGVAVYDPLRLAWWSGPNWVESIFTPDGSVPGHHCIILTREEDDSSDLLWIHTRGLRKFGRPDISVRNVPESYSESVIDLCNRFIEHQAFGLVVPEGQAIKVDGLPEGLVCRHTGDLDDPDFNNVHIEIRFPL